MAERISDAEHSVMEVLWDHAPLDAQSIYDRLSGSQSWTLATVKTLLSRLVSKDALATEAQVVSRLLQGAIQPRRRHLQPLVGATLDFQHVLQLARHALAVLDIDELAATHRHRSRRQFVDVDPQQTFRRALDVDQVVAQPRHGLFNGELPVH